MSGFASPAAHAFASAMRLETLISAGRGDVPLVHLRWRCSWCDSTRVNVVLVSKDSAVVPW
jgi:hypothetical protein